MYLPYFKASAATGAINQTSNLPNPNNLIASRSLILSVYTDKSASRLTKYYNSMMILL